MPITLAEPRRIQTHEGEEAMRLGNPTYAGSYRIAYLPDGSRFLEIRRSRGWNRMATPIPRHIRGAYAAAALFGV